MNNNMNQEKIGKFIAKCRKEKNLTQENLAQILGVTDKAISKWENGRCMPDVSLFSELCKTFDITIKELINGEKNTKNTNNTKEKNLILKFLIIFIIISFIFMLILIIYSVNKYSKINIYNFEAYQKINSKYKDKYNDEKAFVFNNIKFYFYDIDNMYVFDKNNKQYEVYSLLKNEQITMSDIWNFLETEYAHHKIDKFTLFDGGTTIYKSKYYSIIKCNTMQKNNDIYFGPTDLEKKLDGNYCGHYNNDNTCFFTRTYHIINIAQDNEYEFVNVTLKKFQGDIALVRVNRDHNLEVGKAYEFKFKTDVQFADTIENIFKYSTLMEVNETAKMGLEQIQESICVNN